MLISIVYDSGYGHTARQAQAVAEGARRVPGMVVNLFAWPRRWCRGKPWK
jgi:multimeric flavodoxin WrbA